MFAIFAIDGVAIVMLYRTAGKGKNAPVSPKAGTRPGTQPDDAAYPGNR